MKRLLANRAVWLNAFRQRAIWRRAATWGLSVGSLQAVLNQGDFWWHHNVSRVVLIKTIMSPLVGFTLVLISSAATYVEKEKEKSS